MKTEKTIARIAALLAAAALLASCAAFSPRGDTGTVSVTIGRSAGAKALGDPVDFYPDFPVFTSATLTISGPDMADVSTTVALSSSTPESFTLALDVPAGSSRVVEVYAPVDWDLTQAYYIGQGHSYEYPTFVKAYGGRATVNVSSTGTTNVAISLEVVETKIVLPNPDNDGQFEFADTIAAGVDSGMTFSTSFSSYDYFRFDRYGRLLMTEGYYNELRMYSSPGGTAQTASVKDLSEYSFQCPFAYSKSGNCLYFAEGSQLYYVDLMNDSVSHLVTLPASVSDSLNNMTAVAVDPDGYVYVAGFSYHYQGENEFQVGSLVKLSVDPVSYAASLKASVSYSSLGLDTATLEYNTILAVTDMMVQGGKLYIAAGEHDSTSVHHGKIVEVWPANLSKIREIGWSPSNLPTSPGKQFYGPTRFLAIAPRKLIVSDEGYDGSNEVDRVVQVNLDSWTFDGIGLEDEVSFFNTYAMLEY